MKSKNTSNRISVCLDDELMAKVNQAHELGYTTSSYIHTLIRGQPIFNIGDARNILQYIATIKSALIDADDKETKEIIMQELNNICHAINSFQKNM